MENRLAVLQMLNTELLYEAAIPLPDINQKELKTGTSTSEMYMYDHGNTIHSSQRWKHPLMGGPISINR